MCTPEYQALTIDLVERGLCKVIHSTASASNGIDFPGIRRVIQYGVDAMLLDFCAWVQHLGRAGRNNNEECLAVIFAPPRFLLPRLPVEGTEMEVHMGKYREPVENVGVSRHVMAHLYKAPCKQRQRGVKRRTEASNANNAEGGDKVQKRTPVELMKDLDPILL